LTGTSGHYYPSWKQLAQSWMLPCADPVVCVGCRLESAGDCGWFLVQLEQIAQVRREHDQATQVHMMSLSQAAAAESALKSRIDALESLVAQSQQDAKSARSHHQSLMEQVSLLTKANEEQGKRVEELTIKLGSQESALAEAAATKHQLDVTKTLLDDTKAELKAALSRVEMKVHEPVIDESESMRWLRESMALRSMMQRTTVDGMFERTRRLPAVKFL
jgi:chromosome segregation ATPase